MMIDTTGTEGPVVDLVTDFRAPRAKVFKTWTEPDLIAKWFMAAPGYLPPLCEVALRELGSWKIVVRPEPDKNHSIISGHFVQIEPDRELAYSWHGNIPGGEYHTLVNVRFEDNEDGKGSRIRLTHGVFRTTGDRDAHAAGWDMCIRGLGRALGEEEETP